MASALRLGLLSTARINHHILPAAQASELVEVVAVASRDGARAAAYAPEHGIARAHEGYDALLADPEVDAVYIPLPNSLHVEWTQRALEAGKHVLCEKPLTDEPDDCEALFDLAERQGLVLATTRRPGGSRSSSAAARSDGCSSSGPRSASRSRGPRTSASTRPSTAARCSTSAPTA